MASRAKSAAQRTVALAPREAGVTLEMTNAGWDALKRAFARFGVDVMALPFDHKAGFINSDAPLEIYRAMVEALPNPPEEAAS